MSEQTHQEFNVAFSDFVINESVSKDELRLVASILPELLTEISRQSDKEV